MILIELYTKIRNFAAKLQKNFDICKKSSNFAANYGEYICLTLKY